MLVKMENPVGTGVAENPYFKPMTLSARGIPSWSNTPIEPKKCYLEYTINNTPVIVTNVNPSTGEIADNKSWFSNDGITFNENTSYYFIRTNDSVALNDYLSSQTTHSVVFILIG